MQIVAPDILSDVAALSPALPIAGFVVGVALWATGWKGHRFWVVLSLTVAAGLYGLFEASTLRAQPLVAGVLLAIAGGVLALHLVRLIAFLSGGCACLVLCQVLAPQLDQPLLSFLAGGLLGITLFRLWWMNLTSASGALLMVYAGLALCQRTFKMDAGVWATRNTLVLNWVVGVLAVLGVAFQFWLAKQKAKDAGKDKDKDKKKDDKKEEKKPEPPKAFWHDWVPPVLRKAG